MFIRPKMFIVVLMNDDSSFSDDIYSYYVFNNRDLALKYIEWSVQEDYKLALTAPNSFCDAICEYHEDEGWGLVQFPNTIKHYYELCETEDVEEEFYKWLKKREN